MTREEPTDRARRVIVACTVVAVLYAAVTPFFYRDLTFAFADVDSLTGMLLVRTVIVGVPSMLALAAVVISARPFVGVSIAVSGAIVMASAELLNLTREGLSLGRDDWMSLIGTAVVGACALLAADFLVRLRPVDTPLLGALAGVLVGLLLAALNLYQIVLAWVFADIDLFLDGYWLRAVATDGLALAVVGLAAGALAQRSGLGQETTGST